MTSAHEQRTLCFTPRQTTSPLSLSWNIFITPVAREAREIMKFPPLCSYKNSVFPKLKPLHNFWTQMVLMFFIHFHLGWQSETYCRAETSYRVNDFLNDLTPRLICSVNEFRCQRLDVISFLLSDNVSMGLTVHRKNGQKIKPDNFLSSILKKKMTVKTHFLWQL